MRIMECKDESIGIVEDFFSDIGLDPRVIVDLCPKFFCREVKDFIEVYCITREIDRFLSETEGLSDIVFAGVSVGRIRGKEFNPSIAFLLALAPYINEVKGGLILVREGMETLFIYGKPIKRDGYRIMRRGKRTYLVLSARKEPLGWGRISDDRLIPITDIGWFIRSGY